ncbi:hypothetical protein BD324DRAFT_616871 [Kockovaella imperatae]|uniref:Zn(2)-C6 fungal-type domain-containing protein n=1 Tax=Kockovaella imperatae TaxID=4999 RepID=A0A1Y1URH4_9TREE|nr:hypothetical protein BD324DRAFT_616871 [Kockovaella imperatae]ORX40207.1 hypothetical protein BD324DRAFT_616871 [Kockovaella imperatae]
MSMGSSDEMTVVSARACDGCRRMKIKCVGREHPPCQRCKSMSLACTVGEAAPLPFKPRLAAEQVQDDSSWSDFT